MVTRESAETDAAPQSLAAILGSPSPHGGAIVVERAADLPVVVVTLNRPGSHNSISLAMWSELATIVRSLSGPERVIVLRGAGTSAFSVGADITEFPTERTTAERALAYSGAIAGSIDAIRDSPVPVIVMIRGLAVGGGCALAAAADLRIADSGARLGIPIGRLGVTLGLSEASALVDLLGRARATALVLGGDLIDTAEALRIGLLDRVSESDALVADTVELARRLAAAAPLTVRSTKRVLAAAAHGMTSEHTEAFTNELTEVYEGSDLREGIAAFIARRDPRFTQTEEQR